MNSKRLQPQKISFNAKKTKKIDPCFSQADATQQNGSSLSQVSMNSTKCPKDVTNLQTQGSTEQSVSSIKTINVTLKGDHMEYTLRYNEGGSLYEAVTSLPAVKEKSDAQKGKEMLVQGTEGIEGYVNLEMTLSCFPEKSHVEITFAQNTNKQDKENQEVPKHNSVSSKGVKFYIHAVGKDLRRIVKSKHLHKEGCKLCIYAFKEETIRQALCRDGRLRPFLESGDRKLIENGDTILENTQLVDDLEGRVFEVEVEKRKFTRADTTENSESEKKRRPNFLAEGIVEQHPSLKGESDEIKANLKKNVEQSKETTLLSKCYKTNFGKLTQNSTLNMQDRFLIHLANSVGCITWNNNSITGSATCFVFCGSYIFTCGHVLREIMGKGVELRNCMSIISQCAKVTFDYDNSWRNVDRYFSIDPSFLLSDEKLDYAVLKLKEDQQLPLGLYRGYDSVPINGSVHIICHPNGELEPSEACVVIPQSQREEKCQIHLQTRKAEGSQSVHMFTPQSFQEIAKNTDVITYNTSLSCSSAGSPVFDSRGALVAMHIAGFPYEYQNAKSSIIEFGVSIKSILRHIYQTGDGKNCFEKIDENILANLDWPGEDVEMMSEENRMELA